MTFSSGYCTVSIRLMDLSVSSGAPARLRAATLRSGRNKFFAKCLSVMPRPFAVADKNVVSSSAGRTTWIVRTRVVTIGHREHHGPVARGSVRVVVVCGGHQFPVTMK